jgi:hypothetical protein
VLTHTTMGSQSERDKWVLTLWSMTTDPVRASQRNNTGSPYWRKCSLLLILLTKRHL